MPRRSGTVVTARASPREQDPLDARGPAGRGGWRAAELLDEAVVATASADAALRAEGVRGELEDGPRVVVEPAHERRVELIGHGGLLEQFAHGGEVLEVVVVEMVDEARRARDHRARALVLGVERAQGVRRDPRAHVRGETGLVRAQVRGEDLA